MRLLLVHLPTIVALLLLACSSGGDLAGSKGGSETTNGITACIVRGDGTPAAGVIARLRRSDFVSTPARLGKSTLNSADIVTDMQGRFIIKDIDPGSYRIEINDTGRNGAILLSSSIDSNSIIDFGITTLKPCAVLTGWIDNGSGAGKELFVQIRGLERLAMVNAAGVFSFTDLPEGDFDIRVVEGSGGAVVERAVVSVTTLAGDSAKVTIAAPFTDSGFVTIHTGAVNISGSPVITDFPLIIRLDAKSFDFSQTLPSGADIQFTKTDGMVLPFEIELWDAVAQKAAIWVRIDTIFGHMAEQRIIMKWGDSTAQRHSAAGAVFDTSCGFAGVWHLDENPVADVPSIIDRTENGFDGIFNGAISSSSSVSGMIGNALWFDGDNNHITTGRCNVEDTYTLSCWVQADDLIGTARRFIWKEYSYTLWYDAIGKGVRVEHFTIKDTTAVWRGIYQDNSRMIPIEPAVWYYLCGTYDGDKIRLYINGELADSTSSIGAAPILSSQVLSIGGRKGEYFKGVMDEVRIENRARSPEWIRLCYVNQKEISPLVTFSR